MIVDDDAPRQTDHESVKAVFLGVVPERVVGQVQELGRFAHVVVGLV